MDTPRIRYTSTEDQVSLAYFDAGEGYPILHLPYPMNRLQLQWEHPIFRASQEALAERYRLVAFDGRGQGLSDKDAVDFSLDGLVKDAEAVVAATGCSIDRGTGAGQRTGVRGAEQCRDADAEQSVAGGGRRALRALPLQHCGRAGPNG